ncbi:MAG: TetR/AcrR family transcriptional regulator [Pseudomonadota bacterium]
MPPVPLQNDHRAAAEAVAGAPPAPLPIDWAPGPWPQRLDFEAFSKTFDLGSDRLYGWLYRVYRADFAVQNERIAVKRLRSILEATFLLANEKGFQAMTLRDLSSKTGLSMGGLYAYISSKEDLVRLIQTFLYEVGGQVMTRMMQEIEGPERRLEALLRGHLYWSERMPSWFYFGFMETKALPAAQRKQAVAAEASNEARIADTIRSGVQARAFACQDPDLAASFAKALLQDWYLKRNKFRKRGISVDHYADTLVGLMQGHLARAAQ